MPLFAIVDNGVVTDCRQMDSAPTLAGPKAAWRKVLPVVDTNPPADEATQVKTGPVVTVEPTRVTRVWTVRSKTAQEIEAEKDVVVNGLNAAVFKILFFLYNEVRVLKGQATVTQAQFKTAVKALL